MQGFEFGWGGARRSVPSQPTGMPTSSTALAATAAAALAVVLWSRRRRRSTAAVEAGHSCPLCGCQDLYLDAAADELRCPRCDCAAAEDGICGAAALDDVGGQVHFVPGFLDDPGVLGRLQAEVAWEQHQDRLPSGALVLQPRLIAYQANDPSLVYSYEGLTTALHPQPFTPEVAAIRAKVEELTGEEFNSCHLNLYRCGADHVSWHTDEDCDLCARPKPRRTHATSLPPGSARPAPGTRHDRRRDSEHRVRLLRRRARLCAAAHAGRAVLARVEAGGALADAAIRSGWGLAARHARHHPAQLVRAPHAPLFHRACATTARLSLRPHREHCVLKQAVGLGERRAGQRINMTFRRVVT